MKRLFDFNEVDWEAYDTLVGDTWDDLIFENYDPEDESGVNEETE